MQLPIGAETEFRDERGDPLGETCLPFAGDVDDTAFQCRRASPLKPLRHVHAHVEQHKRFARPIGAGGDSALPFHDGAFAEQRTRAAQGIVITWTTHRLDEANNA